MNSEKEINKIQKIVSQAIKSDADTNYSVLGTRNKADIVEEFLKEGKLRNIYTEIKDLEVYMDEEDKKYIEQQIKDLQP